MTEPKYVQINSGSLAFSKDIWGKWYCVIFENVGERRFARYMSPTGWQKTSYYFNDKRDAQLAFGKHGWKSLPVITQEIADQTTMEQNCRDMDRISDEELEYDRVDFLN